MRSKTYLILLCVSTLFLASCGTSKTATSGKDSTSYIGSSKEEKNNIEYLRKVYDNEVYANAISSKIKFTISAGKKDLSVSGSLKMKRDEVIRIQLTPFGLMEAGRLEFTKDYVLIMDRINKEYIKTGYDNVEFLEKNGLDFYTLQALFWNSLFLPGEKRVTESMLGKFDVNLEETSQDASISLKHQDINYQWLTDKTNGYIKAVNMSYGLNTSNMANVNCTYSAFMPLGAKMFPTDILLKLKTNLIKNISEISMDISISNMDTSEDWETQTEISSKFKKVSLQEVMSKVMGM